MTLYYEFQLSEEGVASALWLMEHAAAWGIAAVRHDVGAVIQVALFPSDDVGRFKIMLLYGSPAESLED